MAVYKNENGELVDYTKSNTIKPDAELSPTSENSVQNKVVYKEINDLKKSVSDANTLAHENEAGIMDVASVASENDGAIMDIAEIASENDGAIMELAEYIANLESRIEVLEGGQA